MLSNDQQAAIGIAAEKFETKKSIAPVFAITVLVAVGLIGCEKNSGEIVEARSRAGRVDRVLVTHYLMII